MAELMSKSELIQKIAAEHSNNMTRWALPLSLVFNTSEHNQGDIYSTASIDKIVARHSTNFRTHCFNCRSS